MATIFEAFGDAVVRVALNHSSILPRIGIYLIGGVLLTLYGTSLNLAPVDFAAATGMYIATLFVVFQITMTTKCDDTFVASDPITHNQIE